MKRFAAITLLASSVAWAGADPDLHRAVPDGTRVYEGANVEVGSVYEGFLIHFEDAKVVYLSPSRYRVAYEPNALACRNAEDFPIDSARAGRWWRVVFEVLAVRETAREEPAGSGKWKWVQQFDCNYKAIVPVD